MVKFKTDDDKRLLEAAKAVRKRLMSRAIKAWQFDMGTFGSPRCDLKTGDCGTAHCIGGWIDIELGGVGDVNPLSWTLQDVSEGVRDAAHNLFYPINDKYFEAKRYAAVQALDNFIKGYKNAWKGVEV